VLKLLLKGQHNVVEQLLNLGLIVLRDAYLRQNELGVLSGERTQEDGHTPSGLDLLHQRFLQERKTL
jgi:microsomal dipeptidase-like Zn-dependent dipeptidase